MSTAPLKLSTVIPTRNRPEDLLRAVESVFRQTRLPDELLIIDQSNNDLSKEKINAHYQNIKPAANLVYVHDPSVSGLVDAKRVGVAKSKGDIVLFLEDDVILEPDYILQIEKGFLEQPVMMGCCGVVTEVQKTGFLYHWIFRFFHRGIFRDIRVGIHGNQKFWNRSLIPSHYLSGGLSAFRREVFNHVPFDIQNGFFMLEDIDFSTRAARFFGKDKFFINPAARLDHKVSLVNRDALKIRYSRKMKEYFLFYKKNRDKKWCYLNLIWLLCGRFVEAIIVAIKSRRLGPITGMIHGTFLGMRSPLKKEEC